jgi:hypothetical protein
MNDFEDAQFEVQLVLEDLSAEQVRERAAALREDLDAEGALPEQRISLSIRVWGALMASPVLSDDEQFARFTAWCEGLGVVERDAWAAIEQVRKGDSDGR